MTNQAVITALLDQARSLSVAPVQLGLERVERLLTALGDPQQALAVVHVAGTNGKGSVLAFLEAILRHAGYRVGLYTSPHLHTVGERIRVDGQSITDEQLARVLETVLAVNAGRAVTFFELLTVVALCHFRDAGLGQQGVVLLETGLGGRLDATNVVYPRLSIITTIGLDHTEYLGTTLTAIAQEKAGIFKTNVPAVAAPGHVEAERALRRCADEVGAPLGLLGRDFTIFCSGTAPGSPEMRDGLSLGGRLPAGRWLFQEEGERYELPFPGLFGRHQFNNAALAVAGIRRLRQAGWQVPSEAIKAGIHTARWPGRLERFLVRREGHTRALTVWLDGAHNPEACMALAHFLGETGNGPNVFIFAALRDKDVAAMVSILAPCVQRVVTTQVEEERSLTAEALAVVWQTVTHSVQACATPDEALAAASAACTVAGQVVVCGSLYLVGAMRTILLQRG